MDFSEIENEHERKVAEFLNRLEFTPKEFNPIIKENKKQIGEIDSIFEYDNCLFLVEVSIGTQIVNEKKNFFFSKWSDEYNLEILRKQCELKSKKVIRIYFDLIKETPQNHEGLDHITERKEGNKVIYLNTYQKFDGESHRDPSLVKKQFLDYIGYKPQTLFEKFWRILNA